MFAQILGTIVVTGIIFGVLYWIINKSFKKKGGVSIEEKEELLRKKEEELVKARSKVQVLKNEVGVTKEVIEIDNGPYITETQEREILDPTDLTGKSKIRVKVKLPKVDSDGNKLREPNPLAGTGRGTDGWKSK